MNTRQPSTRPSVRWSPRSAVWRLLAALVVMTLSVLGVSTPAHAAALADIDKALDSVQGGGFTPDDTFETGALVRYRITVSCSSLDTDCVTAVVTDVLDPHLTFVQVVAPTVKNSLGQTLPITSSTSGQTVTVNLGTAAAPFTGGQNVELVLVAKVTGYPPDGTIDNHATVTVGGVAKDSPVVTINVPAPRPIWGVQKTAAPTSIVVGETSTFTIQFTTPSLFGNVDITGGTMVDTFPAGAVILDTTGATIPHGGTLDGGVVDYVAHTITWPVGVVPSSKDLNCQPGGVTCVSYWAKNVTMRFPSPDFIAGQTVVNVARADVTYADGTSGTLTDDAAVAFVVPVIHPSLGKSGPAAAVNGETISWSVQGINYGNATEYGWTVTEDLPASGVSGLTLWATYPGSYMPITGVKTPVTFDYLDAAGTWVSWFVWNPGDGFPDRPVPAGATKFRAIATALAPGSYLYFQVKAVVTAEVGDSFTNCVRLSGGDIQEDSTCVTTTVTAPQTQLLVYKAHKFVDAGRTDVAPGEQFTFWVSVERVSGSPLTTIDFTDLLPAQFEYVKTNCLYTTPGTATPDSTGPGQYSPCLASTAVEPVITPGATPTDPTLLQWLDVPSPTGVDTGAQWYSISYDVRAKPGTAVANYTNKVQISNGATDVQSVCVTQYNNYPYTDAGDIDADGLTTDLLCARDDAVQVRLAAAAEITKWDKGPLPNALQSSGEPSDTCPDWDGFTRYPCVAQTNPGGVFDYRFRLENVGNMPLTNFVAYDILPYLGDTGVGQLLSTQQRATEWVPVLTGPLTIENEPADADTTILYNLTTNPCRPELATGAADATWQATCDNTWLSAAQVSDWSTVKSFKILAYQSAGARWLPVEQILLQAPMLAPTTAPDSTRSPLDLSIAWNSVAHREFKINADNSTARQLAAEPLKVGIIVPFSGISVGDYVWLDANRDGLQSPGESPIRDVVVELLDSSGVVVQSTTTDANGYYSFQYLDRSTSYTIRFTAPAGLVFTKTDAGGVTTNDPVADNGTAALDGTTGGDSDATPAADGLTGSVTFTTPATGANKVSDSAAGTVADNPGLDAGFHPATVPVSIGDYVWFDTNRDGQQSAGEMPVSGVTVNLYDSTGTKVGSTTTDTAGYYWFTDLVGGGSYTVEFVKPAGTSFTTQTTGATATDSDADPATGKVSVTAPASGSNVGAATKADDPTIDAGLVEYNLTLAKSETSSGPYYEESTVTFTLTPGNDGPVDALAGWSVTDILPTGLTLVSMTGTGYTCAAATCVADGRLAAGTFGEVITVTATIDANFTGSAKNVAYVAPSADDEEETNPLVVPTTTTDTTSTPTDNDAQAPISVSTLVSVGDFAWVDVNRDGLQTPLEPVLAGVTVTLTDAAGATRSATTDASGYYWFDDLTPGAAYTVTFTAPAGYAVTTQTVAGADPAKDSNPDPVTGSWSFTAPTAGVNQSGAVVTDDPTIDAGFISLNLSLTKALVTAGPFYAGETVEFTLTPHNDGPVDALAGWSVTDILPAGLSLTSMSGSGYACDLALARCSADSVLAAGADGAVITVTATIDAPFVGSLHNVAYVAPATDETAETNPLVVPTTDTDTDSTDTDNDAQAPLVVDSLVSIGDFVWVDVNRNGLQDDGEPAVADVTVNLLDSTGTVIRTTTTDADGYYWFDNLVPGTPYTVQFVKPAGMAFTTANSGDDTVDSDADVVTGTVDVVAPAAGSNDTAPDLTDNPTLDAGLVQLNLSLVKSLTASGPFYAGSTVTFDLTPHNHGPVDALAGWSVTDILPAGLTLVSMTGSGYDCQILTATCTAADILAAAADGATITVTATVDAAFVGTLHNVAYVSPAADETAETNPLVVPDTTTDTNATGTDNDAQAPLVVDSLVSIGDYVWVDTNRNGLQDAGEAPLAGVTVTLYAEDGSTVLATAVTDPDGSYSFVDLVPGRSYVVEFSAPGYAFTTADSGDDAADSDADVVTGRVEVTAPGSGVNGATNPDDPTIDAGVVRLNLTLVKELTATGPFYAGSSVTFALTPHNDGPVDARAGWSVTDILPDGLTLVSMTGAGYTCEGATCTSGSVLAAGADGAVITVTATVDHAFVGTLHNVAYVAPSGDETTETNPLIVPDTTTDTDTTGTDNDAQAPLVVDSLVSVGDYVWLDVDRDGIQDSAEPAIPGVTVTLTDATGAVVATTTTDAKGFYSFVDLTPGATYTITFTRPDGYTFTSQTAGTDGALDSNADLATGAWTFTAPADGTNSATEPDDPTIDAGLVTDQRPLPHTGSDLLPLAGSGLGLLLLGALSVALTRRQQRRVVR